MKREVHHDIEGQRPTLLSFIHERKPGARPATRRNGGHFSAIAAHPEVSLDRHIPTVANTVRQDMATVHDASIHGFDTSMRMITFKDRRGKKRFFLDI
jgi:hypothetical protein